MKTHIYNYWNSVTLFVLLVSCCSIIQAQNTLVLNGGITVLNGGVAGNPVYLVVNESNTTGITRLSGHIHSENQYNFVKWISGTGTGNYIFPFGVAGNPANYIPFTFNKTTAGNSTIDMATWTTDVQNLPHAAATNVGAVTSMTGVSDSVLFAIDRFWDIQTSAAVTADLTFSYLGVENTTSNPTDTVKSQHWNGSAWDPQVGPGNLGVVAGVGTAGPFVGQSTFSPWILTIIPVCEQDTITYNGPFCNDITTPQNITHTGIFTGVFTSSPIGLSIDPSTGAINPSLSTAGTYTVTFTVAATQTCPQMIATTTVTITALDDASFTYSPTTFCLTGSNPTPTITGVAGGTFTMSAPGVINGTTGEINLSTSGLGTFMVYYNTTSSGNPCPGIDSVQVTITAAPSASFSYDAAQYCQDAVNPILTFGLGASGGVFSNSPAGLSVNVGTGAIDLVASTPGIYTVYNTIAASGGCAAALDSTTIEVLQVDSALFTYSPTTFCITGTNPLPILSGTLGGTFTMSAPGVINGTTGEIDLAVSGLGTFTVYYNTIAAGNPCPSLDSLVVNIVNAPGATFTYTNSPYCQGDANELPVFGAGNFAGTFSAAPAGIIFISTTTGELDLTTSSAGTYTIYNNIAASGGCAAALDSFQITINPTYLIPQTAQICQGDSILLGGAYQTSSGVYTDNLTTTNGCDSIISTTLTVDPTITMPVNAAICQGDSILLGGAFQTAAGTYYDTYTTSLGCDSIIETTLTVNPLGSITVNPVVPVCFGSPIILTATGSGNGVITWYSDAAGTIVLGTGSPLSINSASIGTFTFYANEAGTCSSGMDSVVVVVGGVIAGFNATPTTGPIPLSVFFDNTSSTGGGISYSWNFGDGDTSSQFEPTNIYTNIGVYTVTLIVTDGVCSDTATVFIDAFGESAIIIPNVFTPNGDGSNDVFTVDGVNLESVDCVIFNRWGQKLYSWNNVNGFWDGRTTSGSECPDGTYFYIINALGQDGTEYFKKGAFSLIR